MEINNKQI